MSHAFYDTEGLRFRYGNEIAIRQRIAQELVENVQRILLNLNQMWRFEQVETPLIMPRELMSSSYDVDDIFVLQNTIAEKSYALRAETTMGSYLSAVHMLRTTTIRAPLCVWTHGPSFRVENSDGATAAKLRFNQFHQLEFQCIYSSDTKAPVAQTLINELPKTVEKILGLPTRVVDSDRLPTYSEQTTDIEVLWQSPTVNDLDWKEVASMSLRKDFPEIPGNKPYRVFEVAFGTDRLLAIRNGI